MSRDPRYDVLFEPVRIGPVTAPNRFYQTPHCNGMGIAFPSTMAAMRSVKAEGGWGVVCTEQCGFHYSSEIETPAEVQLWDATDIGILARMTEAVHRHGSLAGVELAHSGKSEPNRYSREVPMAPSHSPLRDIHPGQARAMDKSDIRDLRRWHRQAASRAREAGFDIIYVYAGQDDPIVQHFLSRRHNHRTDEYGGSLENRARLMRELIEETKDEVGDTCAVAVRMSIEELLGDAGMTAEGEARDVVEMFSDLPDLWDFNLSDWDNDSPTSRFVGEGTQEQYIRHVKDVTTRPVVGVGRFTSPDTMASMVTRGVLDFIGAARPSIADPFLPRKIEEGRIEDIRECIGCNICVSGNNTGVPMRCTQNPTMGEEWRRGWHPERIPAKTTDDHFLIVGGGPAGLEAARALGQRGYPVTLAESRAEFGGRVTRESRLPGLAEWVRVRDHRLQQITKFPDVKIYLDSRLEVQHVLESGATRVAVATGARWCRDGFGRTNHFGIPGAAERPIVTPDDIMDGAEIEGAVVVFDDDNFYMGGLMAEVLRERALEVTLVTTAPVVSAWTDFTLEQAAIQRRLIEIGVSIRALTNLASVGADHVELACIYSDRRETLDCTSVVMVTAQEPIDTLYHELLGQSEALTDTGISDVVRLGDCLGPGTIAAAVWSGHRYARELEVRLHDEPPFLRERPELSRYWPAPWDRTLGSEA